MVMNPFGTDAVFDVALFAAGREPVRDSELTDCPLRPGRSMAIKLNGYRGRRSGGGRRGPDLDRAGRGRHHRRVERVGDHQRPGVARDRRTAYLPVRRGTGQSILSLAVPTERGSVVGGLLLSKNPRGPSAELTGRSLEPASAAIFPVMVDVDASIGVAVQEGDR